MANTPFDPARTFTAITLHRMKDLYAAKLEAALNTVPDAALLWSEPYPGGNTAGGIVLHMAEHVRRSILRLTGQEHRLAAGMEEHFPADTREGSELARLYRAALDDWEAALLPILDGRLPLTVEQMHQLYHLTEHAGYHLGQVLDRIQAACGVKFEFCRNGLNERFLRERIEEDLRGREGRPWIP